MDLLIEGIVTKEDYDRRLSSLKNKKIDYEESLKNYCIDDKKFILTTEYLLDLVSKSSELFKSSQVDQKRELLKYLLTNLELEGKTLHYEMNKPFNMMLGNTTYTDW